MKKGLYENMNKYNKPVILAVDDDPIILNTVLSILRNDYKIIPLTSAKSALKYLESNTADLILLDCVMPEMTGFVMFEHVLEDEKLRKIPVIFLTSASDGDNEAKALRAGAADYITKPIHSQALHTRIGNQLELLHHRKHLEKSIADKTRMLNEALNLLKTREDVTLNLLARVTELRDCDTGAHIERTTEFVKIIVRHLLQNPENGYILTPEQAEDIVKSAKLHDLGKIAIPDNVLLKQGKLTPEEFDVIKKHTEEGERLLSHTIDGAKSFQTQELSEEESVRIIYADNFLKTARDITYSHHEKWSGEGYPLGLKGAEIPLSARIIALADVYDALTSERPYKNAFSHEESASIIENDSGKHFDPHLVKIFNKYEKDFENITNNPEFTNNLALV
ncbi:MAG: response regulator [Oscillospiraceae bacterium]|jgi:putative two-component system response regulator|nr:response regulator [Oscillospiraceae bacterium]